MDHEKLIIYMYMASIAAPVQDKATNKLELKYVDAKKPNQT